MRHPDIEKLLILQERDTRLDQLQGILDGLPLEKKRLQDKAASAREKLSQAKVKFQELEGQRKNLESEIADLEKKKVRFRNQQMEVKKNEEYQALEKEIEACEGQSSEKEEAELEILYEIDTAREGLAVAEKELGVVEEEIRGDEAKLEERGKRVAAEREEAEKIATEAREGIPASSLAIYEDLRKRVKYPVVVPMQDRRCQGCHLKVSGGTETQVRSGKEITTCEHCGRILYYET
ncbi:MAG: hypothetical protein JJT75_13840 [Opitutales bacterium]|nr:hypothetical protein [Opitutales bacterium]MCH8540742.1 C4-type zinc ribbon domain-containing protein [Opitutales bacterium]